MTDIASILATQCALTKDRPLIVGVSGGADSLCLMELLREAGYNIIIAHFDHQLRQESKQDAQAVQEICKTFSVECIVESADVRAYSQNKKISIEAAARELRYRFLFRLAREKNAQAVAVGHTADDQAETILMHIIRGSSLNGLKGMSYHATIETFDKEIPIIRPLLEMTRAETVKYCKTHNLQFVHDVSNDSLEYKRNKIRHQLIPLLETYNPKIREAMLRLSQTAKDDLQILDSLEDSLWRDCATLQEGFITLDLNLLTGSAEGLRRRLILRAMRTLIPDIDVTHETLMRAGSVIATEGKQSPKQAEGLLATGTLRSRLFEARNDVKKIDLQAGLYLLREGNRIYIAHKDAELPLNLFPQLDSCRSFDTGEKNARPTQPAAACNDVILVSIPSTIELANNWKLKIEVAENFRAEEISASENPLEAWFDADEVAESLHLRNPRAGDKIRPLGLNGHSQKLSDLFTNEKIPRRAREGWLLLCMGEEILWAAGIRSAHKFRVTEKTKNVIYCILTKS